MVAINIWTILLATLSSMVVGSIWYTPKVFGTRWAALAKVDMGRPAATATLAIIVTLFVSFVTAFVLALGTTVTWMALGGSYFLTALLVGVLGWAGFTAARFITHDAFEGRPTSLTVMNIAHELITLVVMAIIIGVWPPAL